MKLLLATLFAGLLGFVAPASAQFAPTPAAQPTFCVQGPGDVQPYVFWGGISAYSMATCGQPIAYVCDTTGGVDVVCDDMVSSTTTGKIVTKTIGGVTCGIGGSTLCLAKIIYNQAPLNATCTVRGSLGTPGTCDAVQTTVANRYRVDGLSCSTLPPCYFASGASSAYALNSSISLTQPFALVAAAYTVNTSSTETFLSVGNASIKFSTSSPGNVLTSCDSSGGTTAANLYQNQTYAPSYVSDIVSTCIGGTGNGLQNTYVGFSGIGITAISTGGSTSASGVPVVMAAGGSGINFWSFGVTTANFTASVSDNTTGLWVPFSIHNSHCLAYGYSCNYSGIGDIAPFKAAWGMRAYNAALVVSPSLQKLFKACSADNTKCSDQMAQLRAGNTLNNTIGGGGSGVGNASCWTTLATGVTYNGTTGVTTLNVNVPSVTVGGNPTGLAATNNFALSDMTGTGSFASLNGGWTATAVTNTGGGDTATLTFVGPTGLTLTVTGGMLSTCTIQVFYDISGNTFCGGPCDLTQNTVANRAIWTYQCRGPGGIDGYVPDYYSNSCATFVAGNSDTYTGPGTVSTGVPFSMMWVARRTGAFTSGQGVLSGNSSSASGFNSSANSVFVTDGINLASGTANDSLFHSVIGESDGTNVHIYVDGMLAGTAATSAGGVLVQPYHLGSNFGSGNFLQGQFLEGGIIDSDITVLAPALSQQPHILWSLQ